MYSIEYASRVADDVVEMRAYDRKRLLDRIEMDSMKTVAVEKTDLPTCIKRAQGKRVVVTHDGIPVALVVGIKGPDEEQVQLGSSDRFWRMIRDRRKDKTLSRAALEETIGARSRMRKKIPRRSES